VGRLGGPGADQRVERLKGGILLVHARRTIAPQAFSLCGADPTTSAARSLRASGRPTA
jgi:hypothetical protein